MVGSIYLRPINDNVSTEKIVFCGALIGKITVVV